MNNNIKRLFTLFCSQIRIIQLQGRVFVKKLIIRFSQIYSYILSLIVTIITFASYFHIELIPEQPGVFFNFATIMIVTASIAFIISLIALWPKTKSIFHIKDMDVIVECCDILEQEGLKIIHTTDTFDMDKIKSKSLVDQFVKLCNKVGFDLKSNIKKNLPSKDFMKTDITLPGEKNRYKLGSICPINFDVNNNKKKRTDSFCLVAFSHIKPGTVELHPTEYRPLLLDMWKNLSNPSIKDETETVNITVMGKRFVTFPDSYTITQRIGMMVETFFEASKNGKCCDTLRICINEKDASNIDFSNLKTIFNYVYGHSVLI